MARGLLASVAFSIASAIPQEACMVRALLVSTVCVAVSVSLWGGVALAAHTCSSDPSSCGELGPLIPFHKDAIHAGLAWTDEEGEQDAEHEKKRAKICYWMRPSEYRGADLVDPLLAPGPGALLPLFEKYVYGRDFVAGFGFRFSTGTHGLDESVATRIAGDLELENSLCFDLNHPDAFRNTGKFDIASLTEADFALNRAAFSNAGHSKGLDYNVFCAGQVQLSTGEWIVVGGHDKAGNNGIRKILIFDPKTQTWSNRGVPPSKAAFLADPTGLDPAAHPNPNDEANTDPPHPSDMRYQRWYPTAVHLPNDDVLILSGTDQDSSLANTVAFGQPCPNAKASPGCSKVRLNVPEVYNRDEDRTVALENAWRVLSMYPIAYVVQTGPGTDDWRVVVIGEVDHSAPGGPFRGDFSDQARGIRVAQYDPWPYSGKTYLFDVRAALRDPKRDAPDESGKYWKEIGSAMLAHESGASTMLVKLDKKGRPISQRLVLFGGTCGVDCAPPADLKRVEMIDFNAPTPTWHLQDDLIQGANQLQAVALPDGKVLITGGTVGRGTGTAGWNNSFHYQLFDPDTGHVTPLVQTNTPWHDHATMLLLPDGSAINMGGNRTDKAYFTGGTCQVGRQCSTPVTRNAGVPVAQIYKPSYFFKGRRPDLRRAPEQIAYGERFELRVSKTAGTIKAVNAIQQHPVTHNHHWNRRVELWFEQTKDDTLKVQAPSVPGAAPPGDYLLFVVDEQGVPSEGQPVRLGGDDVDD